VSTIPGGFLNIASGDFNFAAGLSAIATHTGAFVWADSNGFLNDGISTALAFTSTNVDQFRVRATGGCQIITTTIVDGNGNFTLVYHSSLMVLMGSICDRNRKENFDTVDTVEVLNKLVNVPIKAGTTKLRIHQFATWGQWLRISIRHLALMKRH